MSAVSFDASVWELFGPLAYGATTVLAAPQGQREPSYITSVLRSRRITHIEITPSMLRVVMGTAGFRECTALRYVMSMAEGLPRSLAKEFGSVHPAQLVNTYGPSECTIDTCSYVWGADHASPSANDLVPIGRPLDNVEVHVLDDGLRPVGVGLPGELFVGGAGVGRCYLNRPELTAERFVPHPFSDKPGDRLYRTGDRVRYLADGQLDFLGRVDHQVKIRGFRIELGEIESALLRQPGVAECVVVVREEGGDRRLVAYTAPGEASAEVLRAGLQHELPAYMIPSAFVGLPSLPRTPNGKVDCKSLPNPAPNAPATGYVEPSTAIEQVLAGVWTEVLRLPRVGAHDNFFELGGHSLLATQVTARIYKKLGVDLPVRVMFDAPTVAGLAERVVAAQLAGASPEELADLREAPWSSSPRTRSHAKSGRRDPEERRACVAWPPAAQRPLPRADALR